MGFVNKFILRRILLIIFLLLGIIAAVVAAAWMLMAIIFSPNGKRALNIALAHDQMFNAVTGGDMDETLSERAARLQKSNVRWACVLCKFLDDLDKGHCDDNRG